VCAALASNHGGGCCSDCCLKDDSSACAELTRQLRQCCTVACRTCTANGYLDKAAELSKDVVLSKKGAFEEETS